MTNAVAIWPNEILVPLDEEDETKVRLLAFDPPTDRAWLIELEDKKAVPFEERYSNITTLFKRAPRDGSTLTEAPAPTPAQLAVSERAMARIEPLVKNFDIFDKTKRWELLRNRSEELKHAAQVLRLPGSSEPPPPTGTPKVLFDDLRCYWQNGQNPSALLGTYKGPQGKTTGTANRGRPASDRPIYQLMERDYDWMKAAILKYYLKENSRATIQKTLHLLWAEHYFYIDGNGKECANPRGEKPSYEQIYRYLNTNWPHHVRTRKRVGDKRFEKDHRGTSGSVDVDCHGVGHVYEFDATVADVYLVAKNDIRTIVGKPTLYLIIDRYSRLIVGWYVGFENPNYSSAMQAVLSIYEDKEAVCKRLGLEYNEADWPAHAITPESFLADQGEFVHHKARRMALSLKCSLRNVPGLRPDWKPLVEVQFRLLQQAIAMTPGYQPDAESRKRRSSGSDQNAALNIDQFETEIVAAIIRHNNTVQKTYPMSLDQVNAEVLPIPTRLYRYGITSRMGLLDRMEYNTIRDELLPRETVSVTQHGIEFNKMHYSSKEIEALGWLSKARRGVHKVTIAFDFRLVDAIRVFKSGESGPYFVAELTKNSLQFKGMSVAEVQNHFRGQKALAAAAEDLSDQVNHDYNRSSQVRNKAAAKVLKDEVGKTSRKSRHIDTKDARDEARTDERSRLVSISEQSQNPADGDRPTTKVAAKPSAEVLQFSAGARPRGSKAGGQGTQDLAGATGSSSSDQQDKTEEPAGAQSQAEEQPKVQPAEPRTLTFAERMAAQGRRLRGESDQ